MKKNKAFYLHTYTCSKEPFIKKRYFHTDHIRLNKKQIIVRRKRRSDAVLVFNKLTRETFFFLREGEKKILNWSSTASRIKIYFSPLG